MTKAQVIDLLDTLPDQFELEELFERLLFVQQLQERLAESEKDPGVSLEEARQRLNSPKQRAA
ncbi:MAG: hypothetical protein EOO36_12795 [Cytophagaceae bacterium]|nr:MAG: hypothetical protein EOO36_12795 [Cytophagaceae bacterium]